MAKLAVLVSGSGTILESIIEAGIKIGLVVSDRACRAIRVAMENDISAQIVLRDDFAETFNRDAYSQMLTHILLQNNIDAVAMAGFGTILGKSIFESYRDRILNTHPSLLPKYKGWHAVKDALDAKEKVTGCTVHIATIGVDEGPIIAQERVELYPDDTESSLHERIKKVERVLYPQAIKLFLDKLDSERILGE